MSAIPPPFIFGGPELFMVLLANVIIFGILGPRWIRAQRASGESPPEAPKSAE
ncbi:MAG: hypothetical protein IPO67_15695 [Deltaproteobacteria bacterium]|nr:hypothetical protein [Deltaproteobacteria bacterium]MBK9366021.1 hypothetical protein [Deltaproteobacteria bacterium]MBK9646568.1 hypothetical protein [Deltaproteobacteria bacterium]